MDVHAHNSFSLCCQRGLLFIFSRTAAFFLSAPFVVVYESGACVDPFSFSRRGRDRVVIQIPQPHSIHIEEEEKEGEPSKNAASMHGLVN